MGRRQAVGSLTGKAIGLLASAPAKVQKLQSECRNSHLQHLWCGAT